MFKTYWLYNYLLSSEPYELCTEPNYVHLLDDIRVFRNKDGVFHSDVIATIADNYMKVRAVFKNRALQKSLSELESDIDITKCRIYLTSYYFIYEYIQQDTIEIQLVIYDFLFNPIAEVIDDEDGRPIYCMNILTLNKKLSDDLVSKPELFLKPNLVGCTNQDKVKKSRVKWRKATMLNCQPRCVLKATAFDLLRQDTQWKDMNAEFDSLEKRANKETAPAPLVTTVDDQILVKLPSDEIAPRVDKNINIQIEGLISLAAATSWRSKKKRRVLSESDIVEDESLNRKVICGSKSSEHIDYHFNNHSTNKDNNSVKSHDPFSNENDDIDSLQIRYIQSTQIEEARLACVRPNFVVSPLFHDFKKCQHLTQVNNEQMVAVVSPLAQDSKENCGIIFEAYPTTSSCNRQLDFGNCHHSIQVRRRVENERMVVVGPSSNKRFHFTEITKKLTPAREAAKVMTKTIDSQDIQAIDTNKKGMLTSATDLNFKNSLAITKNAVNATTSPPLLATTKSQDRLSEKEVIAPKSSEDQSGKISCVMTTGTVVFAKPITSHVSKVVTFNNFSTIKTGRQLAIKNPDYESRSKNLSDDEFPNVTECSRNTSNVLNLKPRNSTNLSLSLARTMPSENMAFRSSTAKSSKPAKSPKRVVLRMPLTLPTPNNSLPPYQLGDQKQSEISGHGLSVRLGDKDFKAQLNAIGCGSLYSGRKVLGLVSPHDLVFSRELEKMTNLYCKTANLQG